jgi:hypothetical protein
MIENEAKIDLDGASKPVRVIDCPGHLRLRPKLFSSLADCCAVVFVIDSTTFVSQGDDDSMKQLADFLSSHPTKHRHECTPTRHIQTISDFCSSNSPKQHISTPPPLPLPTHHQPPLLPLVDAAKEAAEILLDLMCSPALLKNADRLLVVCNKTDAMPDELAGILPKNLVKKRLETEIENLRASRSSGLGDTDENSESMQLEVCRGCKKP